MAGVGRRLLRRRSLEGGRIRRMKKEGEERD
jgi:hypothetical protein